MKKSMRKERYVQPELQVFPSCLMAPLLGSVDFGGGAGGAGDGGTEEDAKGFGFEEFRPWDEEFFNE